jgi:nitrite reductase/ring-hydroxylating ferredoxin subunit
MSTPELRWVKVARVGELASGRMKRAELNPLATVTLVNVDGEYHALAGQCSHQSFPLWAGKLLGHRLICPGHAWQFDARTGEVIAPKDGTPVQTYPVRVEGDDILVGWSPKR